MEYFFFLNFILKFLYYKKKEKYNIIYIANIDVYQSSSFEIWLELSKISGFKRLYFMCFRKQVKLYNILFYVIILFLSLPIKLIYIFYNVLKN